MNLKFGGRKLLALGALGLGVFVLAGSSLVALISDAVVSQDNEVLSGTFTGGQHNVQAAYVDPAEVCDNTVAVSDGPLPAAIDNVVDLDFEFDQFGRYVCVVNKGTSPGRVVMSFAAIAQTDTECSPLEDHPDGGNDSTCGAGEGELADVLSVTVFNASSSQIVSSSATCMPAIAQGLTYQSLASTPLELDASLQPGQGCAIRVGFSLRGDATDAELFEAQSDHIVWDIVFTLEDIP